MENSKRKFFPAKKSENASKLLVGVPTPLRAPFFTRSLTLVPRYLLRNHTETGGNQREYSSKPFEHSIVKRILIFKR